MYTIEHVENYFYSNLSFDSLIELKEYLMKEVSYMDLKNRKFILYEYSKLIGTIILLDGYDIAIKFTP